MWKHEMRFDEVVPNTTWIEACVNTRSPIWLRSTQRTFQFLIFFLSQLVQFLNNNQVILHTNIFLNVVVRMKASKEYAGAVRKLNDIIRDGVRDLIRQNPIYQVTERLLGGDCSLTDE